MAEPQIVLADDERITITVRPAVWTSIFRYIFTLGLYEFWRRVHVWVVTDRRVVERRGLLINKSESSLPLFYVQDAAIETFIVWGRIAVSTAGAEGGVDATYWLPKADAREFRTAVLEASHAARERQPQEPSNPA
jgi:hypothetical protein